MLTKEQVIARFKEVHGDKYDYSKVEFKKVTDTITIICPEHGEFSQVVRQHYRGQGCPKCGIDKRTKSKSDDTESFIKKAKKVHGDKYDYSKVKYIDSITKVCIICPEHGEFLIRPDGHINGRGCPKCGNLKKGQDKKISKDVFIERAKETHGNRYDYSKVEYKNSSTKVCIICPEHGEFWQSPSSHLGGRGCPECGKRKRAEMHLLSTSQFIEKAEKIHGKKYDYSKTNYTGCYAKVCIICPKHGEFWQVSSYHLDGCGCPECGKLFSTYEEEILDFLGTLIDKDKILTNNRTILDNYRELDIVIPSLKIAIEFDGLYWHSEIEKSDKNYHLKKTEECESKGYQLIHIFEDEWIYKKDICKSRLAHLLKKDVTKIYARKCEIRQIDYSTYNSFFNENHLQGNVKASYAYGLFYNDELVSAMSFCSLRTNLGFKNKEKENVFELLRFANKIGNTVIGGASKLFNFFIKNIHPSAVISYADRRWSMGNLYEHLGFAQTHISKPSYFYVFGDTRKNRFAFRKDILISKYGCSPEQTEHGFCLANKWYRIYDCGCLCYKWSATNQGINN